MDSYQGDRLKESPKTLDLLTEPEAAKLLRVSQRHLQRLVHLGEGPPRVILGERRIAYPKNGLIAWTEQRTTGKAA
jgi:predicted DNA-binding transcriptional regulator AlpA